MENFDSIVGHETAKKLLSFAIKNDRIAHAYFFTGPAGLGKFKTAVEFAKIIQCRDSAGDAKLASKRDDAIEKGADPDILIINFEEKYEDNFLEEKKAISIAEIRTLEHHLSLFPYNSRYKIAIINEAHKFTDEAANAFLKTLEEPRGNSVIILIAENRHLLPQTLVSRAQIIRFWPVRNTVIADFLHKRGLNFENAEKIAAISHGRPGLAAGFAQKKERLSVYAAEVKNFENFLESKTEDKLAIAEKMAKGGDNIQDTLRLWLTFSRERILSEYSDLSDDNRYGSKKCNPERLLKLAKGLSLTINLISSSNVNKKLVLENLALDI